MDERRATTGLQLAELVAALSLATDLGLGLPQEHVLRQTVIAQRIATAAGAPDPHRSAVFYVSLLAWVGCIADSHELAKWYGDDLRFRSGSYDVDLAGLPMLRYMLGSIGSGSTPLRRLGVLGRFAAGGFREATGTLVSHCQTTGDVAERLGLDPSVRRALSQAFERWDGRGVPDGLGGDEIELAMRIVQIADDVEVHLRVGGPAAALGMLRARRGTAFDPDLVDLVCERSDEVLADLDADDSWEALVGGDGPDGGLDEGQLGDVLRVFADYADLKSPYRLGHSRGVAELAAEAATRLGLTAAEVTLVEHAALVHDLGEIGVPTSVWDRCGPLSTSERERVRTHPYLTERVLARPERLAAIGAVAALHHERLDGSGYPRGLRGDALAMPARLLATADMHNALRQPRPHRPALDRAEAAAVLRDEVTAGRLDGEAVDAVLGAAGHRVRRRPLRPAGLTRREVEVLVLLARGATNKQIAEQLAISRRTVSSHVEHVYTKIGVSTRGAAAMFAMRHRLVDVAGVGADVG